MRKREALYGEFIAECAKLLLDAFTHTLDAPEKFLPLYAMLNRIRLSASQPVLAEAERLLTRITDQYFSRNLTLDEIRDLAHSEGADPLRTVRRGVPGRAEGDPRRSVVARAAKSCRTPAVVAPLRRSPNPDRTSDASLTTLRTASLTLMPYRSPRRAKPMPLPALLADLSWLAKPDRRSLSRDGFSA